MNFLHNPFRKERYPICLTCFSVLEERPSIEWQGEKLFCPKCGYFKRPVEVRGNGKVARKIRAIAKERGIKPL